MLSMLIFAAAAAPAPITIVDALDAPSPGFRCAARDGVQTIENGHKTPPRAKTLNELPNANEYKAVLRRDEYGCQKPLIVNYDIGSAPSKRR